MKTAIISSLIVGTAIGALATSGASIQRKSGTSGLVSAASDIRETMVRGPLLSARTEKANFSPGEPILCRVEATNNSRKVIVLVDTYHPEWDYKLDVRNEAGEKVTLTKDGERLMRNISIYKSVSVEIFPGEAVHADFVINKLFEMTTAGTYSIRVERTFFTPDTQAYTVAKSNIVKVEITQ